MLSVFEEFCNVVAGVNMRASNDKMIAPYEATQIIDYGFVLLLKLIDLMERLDLPHERREIEQISLVIAPRTISYKDSINYLEPVFNAIARLANPMQDKQALLALSDLTAEIVEHCSLQLKKDQDSSEEASLGPVTHQPWHRCDPQSRPGHDETGFRRISDLSVAGGNRFFRRGHARDGYARLPAACVQGNGVLFQPEYVG